MNSYKKLLNNSIVFAIGNMGSKILTFLLVPLYTFTLTTQEYGLMDLSVTTVNLLVPVVSLSIYEGVLRFVMSKKYDSGTILSSGLSMISITSLIILLLLTSLSFFNSLTNVVALSAVVIILQMLRMTFGAYLRAIGKIKLFAVNGILLTFVLAIFNVLFLSAFKFGLSGYFYAFIISELTSVIFLVVAGRLYNELSILKIDLSVVKQLLRYSLPLIPNSIMWWLINASNRYFVVAILGLQANAIFAVASKIPSVLNILSSIFFQAWQLSAIEEYESNSKSDFFSKILNYFVILLIISASGILSVIKPIIQYVIAPEYIESWKFVPLQLIAIVFSSISSFLGANYIASKETGGVLTTSLIGGAASITFNLIFINVFGLYGAGLSSMISFGLMSLIRYKQVNKKMPINLDKVKFIISLLLIFIQSSALFLIQSHILNLIVGLLIITIVIFIYREYTKGISSRIRSMLKI